MNSKQQRPLKKLLGIRGMGAALTAFVGLIIIYIAFGIINPAVFSGQNMLNLLRSMSMLFFLIKVFVLCRHKTSSAYRCFNKTVPLHDRSYLNDNRNGTIPAPDRTYCLSQCWCGKWISG